MVARGGVEERAPRRASNRGAPCTRAVRDSESVGWVTSPVVLTTEPALICFLLCWCPSGVRAGPKLNASLGIMFGSDPFIIVFVESLFFFPVIIVIHVRAGVRQITSGSGVMFDG